jgi:hypothetical protein
MFASVYMPFIFFRNWLKSNFVRETSFPDIENRLTGYVRADLIIVGLIQTVMVLIWMPDLSYLLAIISGDDSLLMHAVAYAEPEKFAVDISFSELNKMGMASLLNIIPALAYKYCGIDPKYFFIAVLYGEIILRPVGIYFVCYGITRIRAAAWICAFIPEVISGAPYNLAYYNIFFWMPYVGNMGLLFASFSAGCFLLRRNKLCWLFHLCCSFMHMSLGLMWGAMLFCFFALQAKRTRNIRPLFRSTAYLFAIFLVSCLPALFWGTTGNIPAPDPLRWKLLHQGHAAIWRTMEYRGYFFVSAMYLVFLIGFLLASAKRIAIDVYEFVFGCSIAMTLTCIIHIVAVHAGFLFVVKAIFSRSSFLFAYLFTPILIAMLWKLFLQKNSPGMGFLACLAIAVHSPFGMIAGASIFCFNSTKKKSIRIAAVFGVFMLVLLYGIVQLNFFGNIRAMLKQMAMSMLIGSADIGSVWWHFSARFQYYKIFLLVIIALLFLGFRFSLYASERLKTIVTLFVVAVVLFHAIKIFPVHLRPVEGDEAVSYQTAQEWAAEYSPDDASFILVDPNIYWSWRSLTRRPVITTWTEGGLYGYGENIDRNNRRLAEWVENHFGKEYRVADWPYTTLSGPELLRRLDEEQLQDFARVFGGDYVVANKMTTKTWYLPVVYENGVYCIYAVSKRAHIDNQ